MPIALDLVGVHGDFGQQLLRVDVVGAIGLPGSGALN
jgi:hypothetical protein